jgi:hypothetical protein
MSVEQKSKSQEVAIRRDLGFVAYFGKKESQQTNIRGELLKFVKGEWYAGQKHAIELGTQMVVNLDTTTLGWQRWEDDRPVDSEMGLLVEGYQPVKREQLSLPPGLNGKNDEWPVDDNGNLSDPWQESRQVLMKDMDGELVHVRDAFEGRQDGNRQAGARMVPEDEGGRRYRLSGCCVAGGYVPASKVWLDRFPSLRSRGLVADQGLRRREGRERHHAGADQDQRG